MAPDMSDSRAHERPVSREELFASGYLQSLDREEEMYGMGRMPEQGYLEQLPASRVLDQHYGQPPPFQYDSQYAQAEQPYMEEFQPSPLFEQRTLPPSMLRPPQQDAPPMQSSPMLDQQYYPHDVQPQYYPHEPSRQQYAMPSQPRMLDQPYAMPSQGPAMQPHEQGFSNPDDPSVLLEDVKELYGPIAVINDWFVNPLADRVSDGVKLVFEGVAALNDLSEPMRSTVQKAVHTAASGVRGATDFVGVTMDYVHCHKCGAVVPAGEYYCPKCGTLRQGVQLDHDQDDSIAASAVQFEGPTTSAMVTRRYSDLSSEAFAPTDFGNGEAYPSMDRMAEGPYMRSPFHSAVLEPQYPTYSSMGNSAMLPRSSMLENSPKYARVMSEAEVLGSQSLVRPSSQGLEASPFRTTPALSAVPTSSGFPTMPRVVNATMPHLVAGGQPRTSLSQEPQGGQQ